MFIRSFASAVAPPLLLLLLLLLLLSVITCSYGNQNQEFINSCGDIHNIIYPFQLQGDRSHAAYDKYFTLSCDQNNRTVLDLSTGKYYVQSMNYTDSSIRLVDVGIQTDDICSSFPLSFLTIGLFDGISLPYAAEDLARTVVFLSCENPIQSPAYVNRTGYNCITGDESSGNEYYSYVAVGGGTFWDFPDSCTLDQAATTSSPRLVGAGASSRVSNMNMSWLDLNKELAYGFEAKLDVGTTSE
ncbi:hypothetical protein RHGRI_001000 [Rhododendron griersonianum]|uniref:Wall-associated receptor kinase galacturonan-binding domain-containing protein n=1 Tax=Rhododendron griersonianum TaxID=479676 RepID=A0AAV6LL58_9ERIC|nr:hypothetical protein RHGRI_001000 [Rhododendron griersonianum]